MVAIYNVGLMFSFLKQDNDALESYRTCKWYYDRDREIFDRSPPLALHRFILQSAKEEEDRVLAAIEAEKESQRRVVAPKTKSALDQDDIFSRIDNIWSRNPDSANNVLSSKETKDLGKDGNFGFILDTARGRFLTEQGTKCHSMMSQPAGSRFCGNAAAETNKRLINSVQLSHSSVPRLQLTQLKKKKNAKEEEDTEAEDKKMLNPDEYFRMRICGDLQIDGAWLNETDPRKRFRQDLIENIVANEKNSNKSMKILREFLMVKRRDRTLKEGPDKDPKDMQKQAYYEVGYKMYSLQHTIRPNTSNEVTRKKVKPQMFHRSIVCRNASQYSTFITSPQSTASAPRLKLSSVAMSESPAKKEQERKKMMTTVAEELQRDICKLEKTVAKKKCWIDLASSKQSLTKRKEKKVEREEASATHDNLAKSIVRRAKEESARREQHAKTTAKHRALPNQLKP